MTNRRELISLGGALAGALMFPLRLPRQWFVTSISGYVILLPKGVGASEWADRLQATSYPNLQEVTFCVFWNGRDPVSAEYADYPVWKMGDGQTEVVKR